MTNVEMLARLRSMLDEATEIFFDDDAELYPALALAELEMAKIIADAWKIRVIKGEEPLKMPVAIMKLRAIETETVESIGQSGDVLSDPALQAVSCRWNPAGALSAGGQQCIELSQGEKALTMMDTPYLEDGYYFWWEEILVYLNPPATADDGEWSFEYIGYPVGITSIAQSGLDAVAHDAIVERACWILLKDRETEQANAHLQMYTGMMKGLII